MLLEDLNPRRQMGHLIGRSVMDSFPFIVRRRTCFLLLADIVAQIVKGLVLAVAIGDNAQFWRAGRVERFQFECECLHRIDGLRIFAGSIASRSWPVKSAIH